MNQIYTDLHNYLKKNNLRKLTEANFFKRQPFDAKNPGKKKQLIGGKAAC